MLAQKNRKIRKYRGSRTCGGGNAKMRRGAGHRGGRGNAGIKKQNKTWYLTHDPSALVEKGRGRPDVPVKIPRSVNVRSLEDRLEDLLESGVVEKKAKKIHVDLSKMGYDKLLGGGTVKNAWVITAGSASKKAVAKVSEAGGEVILPAAPEVEES